MVQATINPRTVEWNNERTLLVLAAFASAALFTGILTTGAGVGEFWAAVSSQCDSFKCSMAVGTAGAYQSGVWGGAVGMAVGPAGSAAGFAAGVATSVAFGM